MDILIIDDTEVEISKLRQELSGRGFNVDYASSCSEALFLLQGRSFDAVTLDFDIDELNGKQLLELLLGEFEGRSVLEGDVPLAEIRHYDKELEDVILRYFSTFSQYHAFLSRNSGMMFAMLSSVDMTNLELPGDTFYAQKNTENSTDYSSERSIADHFIENFEEKFVDNS